MVRAANDGRDNLTHDDVSKPKQHHALKILMRLQLLEWMWAKGPISPISNKNGFFWRENGRKSLFKVGLFFFIVCGIFMEWTQYRGL